jgi:hypothetical protein
MAVLGLLAVALGRPLAGTQGAGSVPEPLLRPTPPDLALPEERRAPAPTRALAPQTTAVAAQAMAKPAVAASRPVPDAAPASSALHRDPEAGRTGQGLAPAVTGAASSAAAHPTRSQTPAPVVEAVSEATDRKGSPVRAAHRQAPAPGLADAQDPSQTITPQGPLQPAVTRAPQASMPPPAVPPAAHGALARPVASPDEGAAPMLRPSCEPVLVPLPAQADLSAAAPAQPPRAATPVAATPEIRIGTIEIRTSPSPAPPPRARALPSRPGPAAQPPARLSHGYGWNGRT